MGLPCVALLTLFPFSVLCNDKTDPALLQMSVAPQGSQLKVKQIYIMPNILFGAYE